MPLALLFKMDASHRWHLPLHQISIVWSLHLKNWETRLRKTVMTCVLATKVIMLDEVIATVRSVEDTGKTQFARFVEERIKEPSVSFYDNISKNNLPLFTSKPKKTPGKSQAKFTRMKCNVELFSWMYISCQARHGDLDTFFQHKCHGWPPALAESINTMRPPTGKAYLLPCLEALAPRPRDTPKGCQNTLV